MDAENILREVERGRESVKSPLTYYHWISDGGNRASRFLTYITYNEVESRVCNILGNIDTIKKIIMIRIRSLRVSRMSVLQWVIIDSRNQAKKVTQKQEAHYEAGD